MTDAELEQFEALAKKFEPKDREKVIKITQSTMHPVFQEINDGGRAAANKDHEKKIGELTTESSGFKTRAEAAEGQLKLIDEKAPDVAKLRKTFDQELETERGKFQTTLSTKDQELADARLDRAVDQLINELAASPHAVDRDYAETVLAKKADVRSRLIADGKVVRVLKQGSTEMHIVPAEGRTAIQHLADELAETVDAKWKTAGKSRGSGTKGSEGGSNSKGERYEEIRKETAARTKTRAEARESGSGLERLGRSRR